MTSTDEQGLSSDRIRGLPEIDARNSCNADVLDSLPSTYQICRLFAFTSKMAITYDALDRHEAPFPYGNQ
ncbi:unnamed protein product [Rotaria socialis]|uniref:Uncharacterized protein n=1 Tax=Rotaria socialis TaxID=392032 RepID=A0A817ULY8_9BILA|nr:unnamed protein product [Rotaria socialis]